MKRNRSSRTLCEQKRNKASIMQLGRPRPLGAIVARCVFVGVCQGEVYDSQPSVAQGTQKRNSSVQYSVLSLTDMMARRLV